MKKSYNRIPDSSVFQSTPSNTWRPWTLRAPFLIAFITLCALLCLAIELATRGCSLHGCHIFGEHSDTRIPTVTNIAYNQLPTILSLCLGLLWALPHHDVMRLEPYFQMSVPGGAAAADSLFLDYPYTFALFIPFKAAWRRHYAVFLSSLVLLLMNLLIVPLISGIFEESILAESFQRNAMRGELDIEHHRLSTKFTYAAFDRAWLDGPLPSFTNDSYALLPVTGDTEKSFGKETWTVDTTLFEAEFRCEEAQTPHVAYTEYRSVSVNITSKDGLSTVALCDLDAWYDQTTFEELRLSPDELRYCNEYTEFVTPWTSIAYQIPSNDSGDVGYMFAWAKGSTPSENTEATRYPLPLDITAIFCYPSYYMQPVTADITMPSGNIEDIQRTGTRTKFQGLMSFEQILNGTIESSTVADYRDSTGKLVGFGYKPQQPPDIDSQLRQRLGNRPDGFATFYQNSSVSSIYMQNRFSLSGFALFGQKNETLSQLLAPETLAEMYDKALKLLFAVAVSTELVMTNSTDFIQVTRRLGTRGFAVNSLWARGTEAGLGVIVLLAMALAVLTYRRSCNLDGEPNSLAAALRLLSESPGLCTQLENAEFNPPNAILGVMNEGGRRYRLDLVPGEGPNVRLLGVSQEAEMVSSDNSSEGYEISPLAKLLVPDEKHPKTWSEKPWALRTISGVLFLSIFAIVALVLIGTFSYARAHNGLPMPGPNNSFEYKFLFSYLPLAVGMAIEPILITLGSSQCMIAPYKALKRGRAPSSKSLTINYDKSPPHFQLLRSLRTGNYVLTALTIAIFLANVLAVALVGLYSAADAGVQMPSSLKISGLFKTPGKEMYYLLDKHLAGSSLPTWTTQEYYVVPPSPEALSGLDGSQEAYETLGIGVDIKCTLVGSDRINYSCIPPKGNETAQCKNVDPGDWNHVMILNPCGADDKEFLRYAWMNPSGDTIVRSKNCSDTFFPIWVERPGDPKPGNKTVPYFNKFESTVLNCTTRDKIVNLTATVHDGQVQKIVNVHPFDKKRAISLYQENTGPEVALSRSFITTIDNWINVTVTDHYINWFNYLMATANNSVVRSSEVVTHLPNDTIIAAAFGDIYRQVFAISTRLHAEELLSTGRSSATTSVSRDRVYVNELMFGISVSILLFTIVVIVALYWGQDRNVVGHLPSSLAGVYAHLYASNAKQQCGKVAGKNPDERAARLKELDGRYSYGPFGNQNHVGVYRNEDTDVGFEMISYVESGADGVYRT